MTLQAAVHHRAVVQQVLPWGTRRDSRATCHFGCWGISLSVESGAFLCGFGSCWQEEDPSVQACAVYSAPRQAGELGLLPDTWGLRRPCPIAMGWMWGCAPSLEVVAMQGFAKHAGVGALIKLHSSRQQNRNVLHCFSSNFSGLFNAVLSSNCSCDLPLSHTAIHSSFSPFGSFNKSLCQKTSKV